MQIGNMIKNWFGNAKNATQTTTNYAANQTREFTQNASKTVENAARNTANKTGDWAENAAANTGETIGNATDAARNTANAAGEKAGELVGAAGASASNLGIKSQNAGSWWKKSIPLVLLLAVGFWAVSHFTGFNPISGIWNKTESSMQALEANVDVVADATGNMASSTMETVKGAFSSFKLPNGENIEFSEGSFGAELTGFLTSDSKEMNKVFTFDNLNFATGSAELKDESKAQLDKLGKVLTAMPNVHIRIEGHTDNTGNGAANKLLSQQRAETTKQYLVSSAKIKSKRIETAGYGSEKPIVSNDTEENRTKNRRTNLVITQK